MTPRLFTPGPTPVPERVQLRMAAPLIHHRTAEFRSTFHHLHEGLQWLFRTSSPVVSLTSSGTGAMEAAMVNLFSPGETVITVNGGKFGARWTTLATTFGMRPVEITVPWGDALREAALVEVLQHHPEARGLLLTHSETSTGTVIDLQALAAAARRVLPDILIGVDGITSVGALPLHFDAWDLDLCVTGSQKGLMAPPGLAFAAMSGRALKALDRATTPRMYFDLRKALAALRTDDTPWTPAITLVLGVDEAITMMREEGLEQIWQRHSRNASALRAGLQAMGLRLFSHAPSDALTAAWLPAGVEWNTLQRTLRDRFDIIVAGGQGEVTGRIVRISHLGHYDGLAMVTVTSAMEAALALCGHASPPGEGVAAVQRALRAATGPGSL